MILYNENFDKLAPTYLFTEMAGRVQKFQKANPAVEIIRLGIGDVTRELPGVCVEALHRAVDEMGRAGTFRGYGPEQGYPFLREKIAEHDYARRGARVQPDEIFVSDGAKCDTANIQEMFAREIKVAIPDPVYPVYLDTNVMAGRTGVSKDGRYAGIHYLDCGPESGFVPQVPQERVDLIYLCSPNNPTGAVMPRKALEAWVAYARQVKALILFDAAYETFIRDEDVPRSIYEIDGAREVAIEFRSYSKTAGFTGTRCAFSVVPRECMAYSNGGKSVSLRDLWLRRQTTKFNGVAYIIQRAAEAVYTEAGQEQIRALSDHYLHNATIIRKALEDRGYRTWGGTNAPYVWSECKMDSWEFFDLLLTKAGVVCTPGVGFGRKGRGFVRFSAFNSRANTESAISRIQEVLPS